MIVVAIIAILAAVVVPTFTKDANKTRGKTEVNAMFAQMAAKEEVYKQEVGSYLASGAKCPTSPTPAGVDFTTTCVTSGSTWEKLRILPAEGKSSTTTTGSSPGIRCAYQIFTGIAGSTLTVPTGFKTSAGTVSGSETNLASSWWYLTAECDEDNAGGTNATYYESSVDPNIQVLNSGS